VLCEKPVGLTLTETQQVIDRAARTGSAIQIGFQRRFDAGLRAVHDRVHDGRLGTLYSVRMMSHDHQPSDAAFIAASGGIFRDLHVHDLDLLAWLTGSPVATVYATATVREHVRYVDAGDADVSLIHAVTESGVQASIHGARHDPRGHDVRVEAFGSRDSVAAGLTERTPLLPLDGPTAEHPPALPYTGFVDRFREAFRTETSAFLDLVGGAPNPCPPTSALDSLRAAIACELSLRRAEPVRVDEIVTEDH
jgi:myo-inositol 2-dehydrogenase/D-chiro-inositol 1-dehydrogenase